MLVSLGGCEEQGDKPWEKLCKCKGALQRGRGYSYYLEQYLILSDCVCIYGSVLRFLNLPMDDLRHKNTYNN